MRGLQAQNMKLASSELHQRLEHLVTYSTQMIFVSGEGVGRKFQLAETFLAELGAETNVAYFPASDNLAISDYRQKILSQLSSSALFDTSRPLAESFSRTVNHTNGSLLICIANADILPKPFLKELWDLVLQNRFARDRFHLNILLFADEQWATQAKSWLPSQHQEQPVLVSTATQQQEQAEFEGSELDQLIADKRQKFAERIEQRQQSYMQERPVPVIKTWWMKLLLACAFVLSFGSILLWQHYDVTKDAVAEFASFLFQHEVSQEPSADDNSEEIASAELITEPVTVIAQLPTQVSSESQAVDSGVDIDEKASTDTLVTDWQSAVQSLDDKLVTVSSDTSLPDVQPQELKNTEVVSKIDISEKTDITPAADTENLVVQDELAVVDMDKIQTTEVQDYQVPDIVPEVKTNQPEHADQEAELLKLAENNYMLQLSAMSSREVLQAFIRQHQLEDKVWVYVTQRYGGDWHVLLLAQPFASLAEARSAVSGLSTQLQTIKPFAKSVKQIHKEINIL